MTSLVPADGQQQLPFPGGESELAVTWPILWWTS
jgi:hypothetical protein